MSNPQMASVQNKGYAHICKYGTWDLWRNPDGTYFASQGRAKVPVSKDFIVKVIDERVPRV